MKKQTTLITLLMTGLCATAITFASADPTPEPAQTSTTSAATTDAAPAPKGQDVSAKVDKRLQMMTKNLSLTDDQQTKIRKIMLDSMTAMSADKTVGEEGSRGKKMEGMKKMRADIRAVLTPDQQTKFDASAEHMHKKKEDKKDSETK